MAKNRTRELSMRKIREVLRLGLECKLGNREIAYSCSISPASVSNYLKQALNAGLAYKQMEQLNDEELRVVLKSRTSEKKKVARPEPDWSFIHEELRKKGVTRQLLWEEYKAIQPDGYQLSQFYERYNRWKKKLGVSMRQSHKAGEKLFVDYSGQTFPVIDRSSGEVGNNKKRH